MSLAWEVTNEDIVEALKQNCSAHEESDVLEVRSYLDEDRVQKAILHSDDIEIQCDYAQEEILKQIREQ